MSSSRIFNSLVVKASSNNQLFCFIRTIGREGVVFNRLVNAQITGVLLRNPMGPQLYRARISFWKDSALIEQAKKYSNTGECVNVTFDEYSPGFDVATKIESTGRGYEDFFYKWK